MNKYILFIALVVLANISPSYGLATFNKDDSIKTLRLAFASYCSLPSIKSWSCSYCRQTPSFISIYAFNEHAHQGFVGIRDNSELVVSFRGSANIENWIQNLKFFKDPYKNIQGAQIHRGFYQSFNAIKSYMYQGLSTARSACPSCKRIRFTGHSLGGALASIAALDVAENSAYSGFYISVVNYGAPRIGNDKFAGYLRSKVPNTIRLVHNKDNVPHLPAKLMGYNHTPREVWERNGDYKVCSDSNGEDSSCSNGALGIGIGDHLKYMGIQKSSC